MVSTLLFLKFSLYLQVRSFACRIIWKGHRPEAAPRTGDFRSRRAIWSLEERNRESDFRRIARASGDWEVSRMKDLSEDKTQHSLDIGFLSITESKRKGVHQLKSEEFFFYEIFREFFFLSRLCCVCHLYMPHGRWYMVTF